MNAGNFDALSRYVDERIQALYDKKITVLESVSLQKLLCVNPYLLRAKNIGTVGEIITVLLDKHISAVEEEFFEDFLKELTVQGARQIGSASPSTLSMVGEGRNFYTELIEQIGYCVQKYNGRFMIERAHLINRLTRVFGQEFCESSGAINWRKLVEHNSGNFDLDTL